MGAVDSKMNSTTDFPSPVRFQPVLDVPLEAKAVKLLQSVDPQFPDSADAFLGHFGFKLVDSLKIFMQSIVVLISSPSHVITTAAMIMLEKLITNGSPKVRLALVKADLIPQLVLHLNPPSLPLLDVQDIHMCLISIIAQSLWLATPDGLNKLRCRYHDEQQAVHETILKQIIVPSEKYICHLCANRFSIVNGVLSMRFMSLIAYLLELSPYYQPTMDFVHHVPVVLTIPSCLTFFENEDSINIGLDRMIDPQREWNIKRGEVRQMWKTVYRQLRMEGIEDVFEEKLRNDLNRMRGRWIVACSISFNRLQGMNLPRPCSDFIWTTPIRHSEIFAAFIFPSSSPLSDLDFWPILHHIADCSQPPSHDPPFTPRPVSDLIPHRHCSKFLHRTPPATVFPSLVIAQLGHAQHRVRCASDLEATTPPLTTSNTFSLCGGVDSRTIAGHLKMSLDTPTPTYTLLSNSIDGVPTPRINHRSVSAFGRFWVFGGRNDEKLLLNDLHSFVPTNHSWEQHTDTGLEAPTAREDMSLCEHAGSLFMFGGHGMDSNGEENRLNDLWQFSIERNRWTKLVPLSEDMPAGVKGAAMILLHQQLHVFGGRFSDESVSNELWVFSLVESKWTHLNGSFKPNILENSASPLSPEPSLAAREQPAIWTKTIEIDGEEHDLLLVCAGLSETDQSILTIDRIILASEYSSDQNFVFTTPFSFPASAFPKNPIGIAACTVVVEDGIVSMGGLDGDELRPFWTYWKVSELTLDSSDDKYEVQTASGRISSGSVALLGKQVFMFGGSVSEQLRTDPTRNHNRMFISTLTDTFRCSPGTVVDSSAPSSAGCSITPTGTFARKFGTTSPRLCSVGTTNRFEVATRGYHCVSCPASSFAGTDGSSTCTPCTDPNGWCPVGSRVGNATIPSEPNGMTSRVQDFHTLDELQALNLLIPLFGVLIGIVVASCFLWCPCSKKWFWRLDWMDGYHHTRVNRVTRVSEKVLRKSLLGTCLFVIFVFFTVGTITSILLEFFLNNKFESTTMIVELSLPSDPKMKVMETPTAELGLAINQMNRQCTLNDTLAEEEGRIGWVADGELCSEEIKVHFGRIQTNSPPTIACRLLSTNTTLRYSPTVDCLLSISLDTPTFEFDVTAPAPSISFEVDNPEAVAYGFAAFMRTDTNREKDTNSPNETISGLGSFVVDSKGLMFKGPTPTVFSFDLQRSRYKAADNELSYGLFVSSADVTAGSTSGFDELYSNFGLAVQFEFVKDAQIILIDRVYRQKVAELLATLFSTALGFFGECSALVINFLNSSSFLCLLPKTSSNVSFHLHWTL
ncbi:hypothetical protein BLNAU_22168 [Blattamonas nauphoetae]|uniref:Uncharacterized protein n=1 Tax=Blattamonas nauphoetae TaxID=2049346 RepID=A0ABQ9WUT7_9EUKA|nr:hypothetical protein BLNAU_22168 [Blattamonas nauphoetae]